MKTIYLIRHGEAQANADGVLAGSLNDSPLTEKGKQQAKEVAALIAPLPIEVIITSPLQRASLTAHIIANNIGYKGEIIINPLFLERNFGSATGKPLASALPLVDDGTAAGLETITDFHGRAVKALDDLRLLPQKHILVVSHAGFARMIGAIIMKYKPEDFLQHKSLGNAEIYEFNLD